MPRIRYFNILRRAATPRLKMLSASPAKSRPLAATTKRRSRNIRSYIIYAPRGLNSWRGCSAKFTTPVVSTANCATRCCVNGPSRAASICPWLYGEQPELPHVDSSLCRHRRGSTPDKQTTTVSGSRPRTVTLHLAQTDDRNGFSSGMSAWTLPRPGALGDRSVHRFRPTARCPKQWPKSYLS